MLGGADLVEVDDAVELVAERGYGSKSRRGRGSGIGVLAARRQLVLGVLDIVASIAASISGAAAPPVSALTLKPLSVHGLWLAVITMPAPAPSSQ